MMVRVTRQDALNYHSEGRPGKIELRITKPCEDQRDLALAYTPGVAEPVREITADAERVYQYTAKGNLVAVITNGSAVLGLGEAGPLAAKPVMEGKAVLFKRFADIDAFDIELDASDPEEVVRVVRALAPTFGGINLEDIKAPGCFYIEEMLCRQLDIPVFHDDQHGTAIITGAALLNALALVGKPIGRAQVVICGAGASGVACARFFLRLGVDPKRLIMCDSYGVIYEGRQEDMNPYKAPFARQTSLRTLTEALVGADVCLGLSVAGIISPEMLQAMAPKPIIFALANPDPEIGYEEARRARPDAIVATGRSDYPNQVNNVLGFPFVFRGALDVRARAINEEMKVAAARALAALAREQVPDSVCRLYGVEYMKFGPDYIIPKPLDPRVLAWVAPAVAEAAMASGVARQRIELGAYRARLEGQSDGRHAIRQVFVQQARHNPKRVVFPEGEETNVIRAALIMQREGTGRPILLGRPAAVAKRLAGLGSSERLEVVDPALSPNFTRYATELFALRQRKGLTRQEAFSWARDPLVFAALMVRKDAADALVAGVTQSYGEVVRVALQVIGPGPADQPVAGMYMVIVGGQVYYFTDPVVNIDPSADELAAIAIQAAARVRSTGVEPRIAMLSFSTFGTRRHPLADKMRRAAELVKERAPALVVDGEMQADAAVVPAILEQDYPFSDLTGVANVLVFPNLEAANIAFHLVHRLGGAEVVGPLFLGLAKPVHVVSAEASADEIAHVAAMAVVAATEPAKALLRRKAES